jgi:AAA15 family ATPase/GTPase
MLKKWGLTNFKSIYNADVDLAPLTVLTGTNSSGKSSFIQSILLIAQTMHNKNYEHPLILNGKFVDLGQFDDIVSYREDNNNEQRENAPIGIRWEIKCKGDIDQTRFVSEYMNPITAANKEARESFL